MSHPRSPFERRWLLVQYAEAPSGQQLHRICARFNTSDAAPVVDTRASRDLSMREVQNGMSEIRVVVPTPDAMAAMRTFERRAEYSRTVAVSLWYRRMHGIHTPHR